VSRFAESRWGCGVVLSAAFSVALVSNLSYFFLFAPLPAVYAGPEPVQIAYIAVPEDDIAAYFQALYAPSGTTIHTNISFTSAGDGVTVYYDHWEDGFEADIANPIQASTQVWGDGDLTNGVAPGYPADILNSGDSVILENDVPTPRVQANQFYDGGDKIASTRGIAITRAAYPLDPGPVAAESTSVYDTSRYGTSFTTPIGENTPGTEQGTANGMFAYTAASITASEENTTVNIDTDADGVDDITMVLDEGESCYVNGGVAEGATITADEPILAGLMTGDSNNAIEGRWFELLPTAFWADSFITPVGTSGALPTDVILYNPNNSAITVDVTDNGGAAGSINVGANSSARWRMASNSGARFASTLGQVFGAISTIDYDDSAHDWGFAVVPESLLTTRVVTGWAPGSSDLFVNGSPVWLASPRSIAPILCPREFVLVHNHSHGLRSVRRHRSCGDRRFVRIDELHQCCSRPGIMRGSFGNRDLHGRGHRYRWLDRHRDHCGSRCHRSRGHRAPQHSVGHVDNDRPQPRQ
jgi:hypothetical protein